MLQLVVLINVSPSAKTCYTRLAWTKERFSAHASESWES